jgi:hypothetical protein
MALTPVLTATVSLQLDVTPTLAPLPVPVDPTPEPSGGDQEPPALPVYAPPVDIPQPVIRRISETYTPPGMDNDWKASEWVADSSIDVEWGYPQLLLNGRDYTSRFGALTDVQWSRVEGVGSHQAKIEMPRQTPEAAWPTGAAAKDFEIGANVVYRYALVGGGYLVRHNGVLISSEHDSDDGTLVMESLGILRTANEQVRDPSADLTPKDVGHVIADVLNGTISRRFKTMVKETTGLMTGVTGGWENLLDFAQHLLATAIDDGEQYTIECETTTPVLVKKDTTTIHARVHGQRGIKVRLRKDGTSISNVIKGEGINSSGGRWRNMRYPNWHYDATPAFPNWSPIRSITVGTKDSQTDAGNGVSVWQKRADRPVTGEFSRGDLDRMHDIQREDGITVDNYLGPQTWASTFNTGSNTGTTDGAFIMPLAALTQCRKRKYNSDGSDNGANPNYDGSVLVFERYINFGRGVSKAEGIASAREILARDSTAGWVGSIVFSIDPPQMSRFALTEGMNIEVQNWRPGVNVQVHVISVECSKEGIVTVQVDSKARDWPTVASIEERERGAVNPIKRQQRRLLWGDIPKENAVYDAESPAGRLPQHAIMAGLWDVRRIPLMQAGSVVKSTLTTSSPAQEFITAVFGKEVTANWLRDNIGNPLTSATDQWSVKADLLESKGLLQVFGRKEQPAGYYPRTKTDPSGNTGATVTGRMVYDSSWDMASSNRDWVWVATFSAVSCKLEGSFYGRPVTD